MRDKTNCPNCGAALDGDKCAFCGTTFYDFSSIEEGKPCYMRIRSNALHHNGKNVKTLITMRAVPKLETINVSSESVTATDFEGRQLVTFETNRNMDIQMNFRAIQDKDSTLMKLEPWDVNRLLE